MANAITQITKYIPYLDEVYKMESRTAVLETPADFVRETLDAKTVLVAKTSMNGLANYDRSNGFVNGDVTLTWESHTFAFDRGRSFQIDACDDMETVGLAFAGVSSQFLRTQVVPEIDAVRFAAYATAAIGAGNTKSAVLTKETVDDAILEAETVMGEAEVNLENAYLFITPTVYGMVKASPSFTRTLVPSENPNRNFGEYDNMPVIVVPQSRFYTAVTLNDGKTSTQEVGGYVKNGEEINFMIVDPAAVMQITKHAKLRVFEPDVNQSADAYKIDYRIYHDAWVLGNKAKGIYAHTKA